MPLFGLLECMLKCTGRPSCELPPLPPLPDAPVGNCRHIVIHQSNPCILHSLAESL